MLISEIFYSIQGEGELTGVPSVFIRTSGCNLRCRWCDTPYASWRAQGTEMSVDKILEEVLLFPSTHVVLTGGEPMVAKDIHLLASRLREAKKHLTIETAGTIAPEGIACDLASLSPKLRNSQPHEGEIEKGWRDRHETTRLQPEILRQWVGNYHFQLKFVVEQSHDLPELEDLISKIGSPIHPHQVQLMPQGVDLTTIRSRDTFLIALCKEKGYRYCQRLHVELFGNTRGT